MKTLLTGVAFALAIFFTSQAFAMPYCPNAGTHAPPVLFWLVS